MKHLVLTSHFGKVVSYVGKSIETGSRLNSTPRFRVERWLVVVRLDIVLCKCRLFFGCWKFLIKQHHSMWCYISSLPTQVATQLHCKSWKTRKPSPVEIADISYSLWPSTGGDAEGSLPGTAAAEGQCARLHPTTGTCGNTPSTCIQYEFTVIRYTQIYRPWTTLFICNHFWTSPLWRLYHSITHVEYQGLDKL